MTLPGRKPFKFKLTVTGGKRMKKTVYSGDLAAETDEDLEAFLAAFRQLMAQGRKIDRQAPPPGSVRIAK